MTKMQRTFLYISFAVVFLISFFLMLFYGKETFYIEKEAISLP